MDEDLPNFSSQDDFSQIPDLSGIDGKQPKSINYKYKYLPLKISCRPIKPL